MTIAYGMLHAKRKVAVVEANKFGGVVQNSGSTRKKELASVALHAVRNHRFADLGITKDNRPSWRATMEWVNQIEDSESDDVQNRMMLSGIDTITGSARFMTNYVISVDGMQYSADQFVIATGAYDRIIPCQEGQEYLEDSADFLTSMNVPNDITFIGAGIVSFAFVSIAKAFGKKVHVIQHNERALAAFDQDFVSKLISHYVQQGVDFHFNNSIQTVAKQDDQLVITTDQGERFTTQAIYRAAGRVPNVKQLKLEKAGVQYNSHGIIVDQTLRTTQDNIFACGDCIAAEVPKLATYAAYQASYLSKRMTGDNLTAIKYPLPSMSTFSEPRIAQTGVLINDAKKQPKDYQIQTIIMKDWLDQRRYLSEISEVKLVINRASGRVVGASVISDDADILINYITLMLNAGVTKQQLKQMIFAYPSMGEDLSRFWQ